MITGTVTADLEAVVALRVRGARGRTRQVRAVIDTGFDGALTLSAALLTGLGAPLVGRQAGILADGSEVLLDIYEATVIWEGRPRLVAVAVAEGVPLLGMLLLEGYELRIHVNDGGLVQLSPLPAA